MGCQSSSMDIYNSIKSKYGLDNVKQFLIINSQIRFIESSKQDISKVVSNKLEEKRHRQLNKIQDLTNAINLSYDNTIDRIQLANPKSIEKAEHVHRTRIQNILGYDEVMKKVQNYQKNCQKVLDERTKKSISQVSIFLDNLSKQKRKQLPEIKKYQNLQQDQQQQFLKIGHNKNKNAIENRLTQIQKVIQNKCNYQNYESNLDGVVKNEELKNIQDFAHSSFKTGQDRINSNPGCATC